MDHELLDERDRHASFVDSRSRPLDRPATHIAAREDAGYAGFQQVRVALLRPAARFGHGIAGADVAAVVARNCVGQPAGLGIGADEDEHAAAVHALHVSGGAIEQVDGGQRLVARTSGDTDVSTSAAASSSTAIME